MFVSGLIAHAHVKVGSMPVVRNLNSAECFDDIPNGRRLYVSDISLQVLLVLTFVLQEMVVAPLGAVAVGLPLLIDMQQRQMVTLRHKELLPC